MKTVYGRLLVDNTRTDETARSRMLEFGIECGFNRGGVCGDKSNELITSRW